MTGPALCEVCGEHNLASVLHSDFEHVCYDCVEDGQALKDVDGIYRKTATCGCGRVGAVNYEEDRYYCGGNQWCVP